MTTPDRKLETLAEGGAFFECPRWHDGRLWVSDFWRYRVFAIAPDGTAETVAEVSGAPTGLGWLPDGALLVASMQDGKLLRVEGGRNVEHADLSAHAAPQLNDMVVDAGGRAYVSTIDFEAWDEMPATNLVRVDPDGSVSVAADGLHFPNGLAIAPDGRTLIVAESWAQRLTAFEIQPDGSLTGRREWASFAPGTATGESEQWACAPDGITVDAEGALWVADAANKRAIRVREGGEIVEEIGAGELDVLACMLGGDDGRTLFLCATPDYQVPPEEAARTLPARILSCRVDVPHAGRP